MLENKINEDLKQAMKSKDSVKLETLRMVKLAFGNAKTEKNAKEFNDDRALKILQKLVKDREDVADTYVKAGRQELADKELSEAQVIKKYLPEEISSEDLYKIIQLVVIELEPTKKDIGKVMKRVTELASESGKMVVGSKIVDAVKHLLV